MVGLNITGYLIVITIIYTCTQQRDFGLGIESTSHIESIWSQLKSFIIKFYQALKSDNFIYFIRELEFYIRIYHEYLKL